MTNQYRHPLTNQPPDTTDPASSENAAVGDVQMAVAISEAAAFQALGPPPRRLSVRISTSIYRWFDQPQDALLFAHSLEQDSYIIDWHCEMITLIWNE